MARRVLKILALLPLAGIATLVGLLAALRVEHELPVTLPVPTGPYAVGRVVEDWTDSTSDPVAPVQGARRELLVWIWYPAAGAPSVRTTPYLPESMSAAVARARDGVISNFFTRDLAKVRAHSVVAAVPSDREKTYPVLIMRGGASAEVWNYSTLAEDLASHGYVVVGFDAPYLTGVVAFPDGRVVTRTPQNNPELAFGRPDSAQRIDRLMSAWTGDIGFVLDRLARLDVADSGRFAGRLDLSRVGVFGHSFGGAAAMLFCHEDARCRAGVDIDGAPVGRVVTEGIGRPFMFILSDHGGDHDRESQQILTNIHSIFGRLPDGGRQLVAIRGANHFLFSDDGALLKSHLVMATLRRLGVIGLDGRRQLAVSAYWLRTFFDRYLARSDSSPAEHRHSTASA